MVAQNNRSESMSQSLFGDINRANHDSDSGCYDLTSVHHTWKLLERWICVGVLLLCITTVASAQWQRISPDSGRCWGFFVHGDSIAIEADTAFVVSYDAGAHWHQIPLSILRDSTDTNDLFGLAVAPTCFSIWYAAKYTYNSLGNLRVGVYRSIDAGEHWEHRYTLPDNFAGVNSWGMRCSWGDANTIFALMGGDDPKYLYHSQDGGLTWYELEPKGVEDALAFVQDQKDTSLLFTMTPRPDSGYYSIQWSTNSGDSWLSCRASMGGSYGTPRWLSSGLPNRGDFYFRPFGLPGTGLRHTSDFGQTWETVGDLPPVWYIWDVVFDPRNMEHQFATVEDQGGGGGVLFRDHDGWHLWSNWDSVKPAGAGNVFFDTTTELFYLGNLSGLWVYPTNATEVNEARRSPNSFAMLEQNWPNPVADNTNFSFQLPPHMNAVFNLYDIKGTLLMTQPILGSSVSFTRNLSYLPDGEYLYSIKTGTSLQSKKLVKVK